LLLKRLSPDQPIIGRRDPLPTGNMASSGWQEIIYTAKKTLNKIVAVRAAP
jgi:hypothetical protein